MIKKNITTLWNHFKNDSLFRNSIYLMLGTAVQAGLGFIFWTVATHLYTSGQVGISTTLVSAIALIGTLSVLGLNTALIKYLPDAKDKNSFISTTVIVSTLTALSISILYLCFLRVIAPRLAVNASWPQLGVFVILGSVATALYMLSDSLFISLRKAKFVTITAAFYSTTKLLFIFLAIGFGAYGPFSAQIVGVLAAVCVSAGIQIYLLSFRYKATLDTGVIKGIRSFAFGSYLASLANSLPGLLLPIVILNNLGAPSVAYFFVSLMVANVLFMIPQATTQAQFAEGANEPKYINAHLRRASKQITFLIVPAIALTILLAPYILSVFGSAYTSGGTTILRLLSLSGLWVSINYVLTTVLRLKNMIKSLVLISIVTTLATFFSAYALIGFGLLGIGIGWNIGELLTSILLMVFLLRAPKGADNAKELI